MKRAGDLMGRIADRDNLHLAFWKAAKRKWDRPAVIAFSKDLETNLRQLRADLLAENWWPGPYAVFKVFDPKERVIHAAAFHDRVVHHAVMNICGHYFEKALIFDTYASRTGKGRLAALKRGLGFSRNHEWFLKMDISKYFDSVSHRLLLQGLAERFKDRRLLRLFARILDSYHTAPGKGLPIGSLTSQYFANFFLGRLDRFSRVRPC